MDDLISRQAAIDALDGEITVTGRANAEAVRGYARLVADRLKRLPSAQPERRKGKWVYNKNGIDWNLPAWTCSECHCRNDNIPTVIKFGNEYKRIADPRSWEGSRFCPNCGADMRGEQDE